MDCQAYRPLEIEVEEAGCASVVPIALGGQCLILVQGLEHSFGEAAVGGGGGASHGSADLAQPSGLSQAV